MGNTDDSALLKAEISDFLSMNHVFLCPTGWAAAYGAITGIIRQKDFIVMDDLAHSSFQQGSYAATVKDNVIKFNHLDNQDLEAKLNEIRSSAKNASILVITEGLYSMDGDYTDFSQFVSICKEYNATTLVDVAHDLGCTGADGTGTLGIFNALKDIDIVVGSFSKSFGTNGGFIATHNESLSWAIKAFGSSYTYSTAMSPVQVAIARKALQIIRSSEGEKLRLKPVSYTHLTLPTTSRV